VKGEASNIYIKNLPLHVESRDVD